MPMSAKRKIVEISMFWNEDTIVKERILNTLEYADFFLIAEGNESHSGLIKRTEYQLPKQLRELEGIPKDRVIFVPVDLSKAPGKNPFERELLVRDLALKVAIEKKLLQKDDVLIIQDFDEFLDPNAKALLFQHFSPLTFWRKALRLKYQMTYYKLNLLESSSKWDLALAIRGSTALEANFSPNYFRHDIRKKAFPTTQAFIGWHHSYLGNTEKMIEKIKSFSHALDHMVKEVTEDDLKKRFENGQDLFGRDFKYTKIDYAAQGGIQALKNRTDLMV